MDQFDIHEELTPHLDGSNVKFGCSRGLSKLNIAKVASN